MKPKAKVYEATEAGNVMPADKTQTAPKDKYADVTLLGFSLNRFSPDVRFLIVAGSLLFFHLAYGYVQELIFKARKYPYPLFSTVLQFLIYTLLAVFERANSGEQVTLRRGARMGHFTLAMAYVVGRGMGTEAIKYLDYTTKVLFQSSQLIPVIVIGMLLLGKRFSLVQYLATTFLIGGLFLFSNADAMSSPTFQFKGIIFMLFHIFAMASKTNIQEKLVKSPERISNYEIALYSNFYGLLVMIPIALLTGDLIPGLFYTLEQPTLFLYIVLEFFLGYAGSMASLALVKCSDAFVATIVTSSRKAITIVLSFVIFDKDVSLRHVLACFLFFSGILLNVWEKKGQKAKEKEKET